MALRTIARSVGTAVLLAIFLFTGVAPAWAQGAGSDPRLLDLTLVSPGGRNCTDPGLQAGSNQAITVTATTQLLPMNRGGSGMPLKMPLRLTVGRPITGIVIDGPVNPTAFPSPVNLRLESTGGFESFNAMGGVVACVNNPAGNAEGVLVFIKASVGPAF